MRQIPLAALAGLAASLSAQELAVDATGTGWVYDRLDLEVRVEPSELGITATGTARLRLALDRSAGPTLAVRRCDFTSVASDDSTVDIGGRHPRIESVRLAKVRLPEPAVRGDVIDVDFAIAMREAGSQLHADGDIALASWTMAWYPFPLPPDDEGFHAGHSRAPGTTRFRLPAGWRAAADGELTELEQGDEGTIETWRVAESMARSFAAGPFRVGTHLVGEREFAVYRLGDNEEASVQAESLAAAIAAMETRFGPFPFASYSIAEVPNRKVSFYGASQQGFLMAASTAFRFGRNLPLFAHEAAHAWWGNTVGTRGPGAILCSESLAQYSAVVAIEALEGAAAATEFLRFSRRGYISVQCARGYFQMVRRERDEPLSRLGNGGWQHDLSDAKGHWVFHMLRRRVGDELFFATLRELIDRHRGGAMSLDDLRAAFVAVAPAKCRLEAFFAQWLDRTGAPELESEWAAHADGGALTITQRQSGGPFELRLDVALHHDDASVTRRELHLVDAEQVYELEVERPVERVELDPDHRLLIWNPEYGPAPHTVKDDAVVPAELRAKYVGDYAIDDRRTLRIVERGERIGGVMGEGTLQLWHVEGHRFRSASGILEFVFEGGEVVAIAFTGDDGRHERAVRQ